MGLDLYHAKRNFKLTPEPRGRVERRKGKGLSFVIQKHAATRLHYDFRLELDGVLKSWAVTKVPSLDTATKRLAVEVEDHPLDYGGFEGTIPKGQYGGGTVQLWDRGTWEPRGDPHEGLKKGNLKFDLHGDRLQGGWALIRMNDRTWKGPKTGKNNWLLIKEKDDYARPGEPDLLLAEETSVKSGKTLDEIANNPRGRVWHSNRDGGAGGEQPKAPAKKTAAAPAAKQKKTAAAPAVKKKPRLKVPAKKAAKPRTHPKA
jgi:bifunctional non-homologous end joining protein LigD